VSTYVCGGPSTGVGMILRGAGEVGNEGTGVATATGIALEVGVGEAG